MDTPYGQMPLIEPFFYMAPIQGVTDALFRNLFHHHFGGFDAAITPFINPQRHSGGKENRLFDVLPENNSTLPVIPQLLNTNADDFLSMADRLQDLGYSHINWNLGCPAPMIARKKRGSGILPYPEMVIDLLDKIIPRLQSQLSIKTRLGYFSPQEILTLLPLLDDYPLQEIIIHARIGKQLYKGGVDLEGFALCHQHSRHELVYNGDITSTAILHQLMKRFPWVHRWMIGRGALADPFLPMSFRKRSIPPDDRFGKLKQFHADLYQGYRQRLFGPSHLLGRMKQYMLYLIASFPQKQKVIKKITKAKTEQDYLQAVGELFTD